MTAISKTEIMEYLFDSVGLNKSEAKEILDALFEEVIVCLEHGDAVRITGFGNFILRQKSARPGRNPRTGEMVTVLPRKVVVFRPGHRLKNSSEAYAN